MAQDTRKDPRAKVLTMTVRYKSATVDEFIEHHSHDVSRGGIYIKTPSPFLPGTLLKFEIRIADDKPMLQGVGRVVWKREAAGAGPDKPAGMGVKFIKVDEASRALIDRLVASKGDATSAYDEEAAAEPGAAASPPGPPPAPALPKTAAANPAPVGAAPARPAGVAPVGPAIRKATMIGLGINNAAAAASGATAAPSRQAPRPADPMFPKTNSEADMPPPEERTVMKQAAQLLEEALKGAGGSIDEVGEGPAPLQPAARSRDRDAAQPAERAAPAAAKASQSAAASPRKADSGAVPLERRPAPAATEPSVSTRPSARAVPLAPSIEPVKKKSSGGRAAISLLLVAGAAAAAYVVMQRREVRAPDAQVTQPAAPVVTVPPPVPEPVAPTPPPSENVVPAAAGSAPVVEPSAAVAKPGPKPVELAPPVEKPLPAAKPAPVEKPAPPVALEPAEKPAPVEKVAPPPKPRPLPKPAEPKPAKPADDNPY